MIGCLHCTDFLGCQQCDVGYTRVEDPDCGEDSIVATGGKVHYCVPDGETDCSSVGSEGGEETGGEGTGGEYPYYDGGCPDLVAISHCDEDPNCATCHSWGGCGLCAPGYFLAGHNFACVNCDTAYGYTCDSCNDWNGCGSCNSGASSWNSACGNSGLFVCPASGGDV